MFIKIAYAVCRHFSRVFEVIYSALVEFSGVHLENVLTVVRQPIESF